MKDASARLRREDGKRPPLPVVVSALIVSVGLWGVIYRQTGRIVWTW
ncbi:hypothetical protein MKL09_18160 [Methylobacterium sp. J-048]|nr:hypothetical protein [Methylobacterium sp. J-048]MCJ2058465.1 hypothetical protein [Methylobacterium sp. J-048]